MNDMTNASKHVASEVDLDEDSLNAIRAILTEDAPVSEQKPARPSAAAAQSEATPAVDEVPAKRSILRKKRKADELPRLKKPIPAPNSQNDRQERKSFLGFAKRGPRALSAPKPTPLPQAVSSENVAGPHGSNAGVLDAIKAYRPTRKHIILAVLALVVVMWPWLVLGIVLLNLFVLLGVFLIFGYDGCWQGAMKAGRWYANRNPERAAVLHKRLDRFAMKWDAVLDRFPEGTVDGLYLPDFGEMAQADERHADALDRRLASLQEKGV